MSATKEFHHEQIEHEQRRAIADTRDYPILFDTEMVQAIISGSKNATRRLFKSPLSKAMEPAHEIYHDGVEWIARLKNGQCYKYPIVCPWGAPGDYLWVKETWKPECVYVNGNAASYYYLADNPSSKSTVNKFRPSIHMPKTAARIWLQITDVKAQRIQTITEAEAWAEGVQLAKILGLGEIGQSNYREGFIAKWISIYGIESFYENPWVWAIKFSVCESKPYIIS